MTRLITPFAPGLEFNNQFAQSTSPNSQTLSAYFVGPAAQLVRYNVASERPLGFIGNYDETGISIDGFEQNAYDWPNRIFGGKIDVNYTKVFIENALLEYWEEDQDLEVVGRNKIRHDDGIRFKTGNGRNRSSVFGIRDVQVGDRVLVNGIDEDDEPFTLATYVQGFEADLGASSTGPAIAGTSNAINAEDDLDVDANASNQGNAALTVSVSNYDGLTYGRPSETYTILVTRGSNGSDQSAARLRITSANGADTQSNVNPGDAGDIFNIGTRGAQAFFGPGTLIAGDSWTVAIDMNYDRPTLSVSGNFNAPDYVDRTYIVEVIVGGVTNMANLVVEVSEVAGLDRRLAFPLVVGLDSVTAPIPLGSYGPTLQFDLATGLSTGDKWSVKMTAAKPDEISTLVLAHNIPENVVRNSGAANLTLSLYMQRDIELPRRSVIPGEFNFTARANDLLIQTGIQLQVDDWVIDGAQMPLTLTANPAFSDVNRMYVSYRAWYPRSTSLLSVSDPSQLATLIGGPIHPDNPLKYGLSLGLTANGNSPIYWFNTGDPSDINNWLAALKAADNTTLPYGFVPFSRDLTVLDAFAGHIDTRSSAAYNMFRRGWFTGDDIESITVLNDKLTSDEEIATAIIADDGERAGEQYTFVTFSDNVSLVDLGVRVGDLLLYNFQTNEWGDVTYDQYPISEVINETSLRIGDGPSVAQGVARKVEIVRSLDAGDRVELFKRGITPYSLNPTLAASAQAVGAKYPGYRYSILPFGTMFDGSLEVPSYFAAGVLAAMRGSIAPHQSMTRMAVPGFTGVKGIELYTPEQLNEIAASGGVIIAPDNATGQLLVRHSVTAGDWDNVNMREESIISNLDSINFYFYSLLDPYIGKANNVPETIAKIKGDLYAGANFLRTVNNLGGLGGQLLDMQIIDIRPSPIAKDTLLIDMVYTLPGPLNKVRNFILIQ